MLTQLQTPIPLQTPKGSAWAVAIIDYGPQWDLQWVTFLNDSGECWTFRNSQIRREANYTFGLSAPTSIPPEMPGPIAGHIPFPLTDNDSVLMRPQLHEIPPGSKRN